MHWVTRFSAILLSFAVISAPSRLGAQGFGKFKKKVTLQRKLPPIAHLTGSFRIDSVARDPQHKEIAQKLADILETEILQHDNQLTPDKNKPDNILSMTLVSFSLPTPRRVTKTSYNNKGQQVGKQYDEVSGSMVVAYQAKTKSGRVLDSDNVTSRFAGEYDSEGNGTAKTVSNALKKPWHVIKPSAGEGEEVPKTGEEVVQLLISQAATGIAARLVRTEETVEVLLARGKGLDDQNKLAEAGLWSRMLEPLETMRPFPKKDDDAYRLYNIAVAYEALAYQAEDPKAAKKFLDLAAINYGKAIDANPGEKYFLQPQNRIHTALAHYKKLEGQGIALAAAPRESSPTAAREAPAPAPAAAGAPSAAPAAVVSHSGPLTNEQVIELAKAGMDEENLIATIKDAPAVNFDFSVAGQLKLVQGGVKGKVLQAIRERANAAPAKKAAAPPKAAPKK